jgi:hypothetical protein
MLIQEIAFIVLPACWLIEIRFLRGEEIFLFTAVSRLALGPTQPPNRVMAGALSSEIK